MREPDVTLVKPDCDVSTVVAKAEVHERSSDDHETKIERAMRRNKDKDVLWKKGADIRKTQIQEEAIKAPCERSANIKEQVKIKLFTNARMREIRRIPSSSST